MPLFDNSLKHVAIQGQSGTRGGIGCIDTTPLQGRATVDELSAVQKTMRVPLHIEMLRMAGRPGGSGRSEDRAFADHGTE